MLGITPKKPTKIIKGLEAQFQDLFISNCSSIFKGAEVIDYEVPLVDVNSIMTKDFHKPTSPRGWGRIDLVLRYKCRVWVVELKFPKPDALNPTFFDALKVVGYCAYYNFQMSAKAKPAIMMPVDCISLEHKIVANELGIGLFGIFRQGNSYKVRDLDKFPSTPLPTVTIGNRKA